MTRVRLVSVAAALLAGASGCLNPGSPWNPKRNTTSNSSAPQTPAAAPVAGATREPAGATAPQDNAEPTAAGSTERRIEEFLNKLTRYDTDNEPTSAPAERKGSKTRGEAGPGQYEPVIAGRPAPQENKPEANVGADLVATGKEPQKPAPAPDKPPAHPREKPRIDRVSVRSSPRAQDPERPGPETMGVNTAPEAADPSSDQSVERMIEELKRQVAGNSGDTDAMWRLTFLQLATGQNFEAAELFKEISGETGQTMASTADLVRRVRQALREPGPATDRALAAIDDLRRRFARNAELVIPKVALCAKVSTFGVYDELSPSALVPNRANRAIVYCEVKNFVSEPTPDERFRVRLTSRLEIMTAEGTSKWKHEEAGIEDVSRQRREDFFLAQLVTFPPELGPGEYVLKVSIEDTTAAKAAEAVYPFRIGTTAVTSAAR